MKNSYRVSVLFLAALLALSPFHLHGQQKRLLQVEDLTRIKTLGDPRISPEGEWVAYTLSYIISDEDRSDTDIYMVPLEGGESLRLTASDQSERSPRWSPDGRYLAFLSARDEKPSQVWLLDRRGGEAWRLTDYPGPVSDLAWSPDGGRLALVVTDEDPDASDSDAENGKKKTPPPIVINRLQFKRDGVGYLTELRNHIHVFELDSRESRQLTEGPYDHSSPVWSPDGRWIAFVSNRTEEPDSNFNTDVFLVTAEGGKPLQVTTSPASDDSPVFTPDGGTIVYLQGGDPADIWYATNNLAAVDVDLESGRAAGARILTPALDRNLSRPQVTPDGRQVVFLLEERGSTRLAQIPLEGGEIVRLVDGDVDVSHFDVGPSGELAVLESRVDMPFELSRVEEGVLRRITDANAEWLEEVALGQVTRFEAIGDDGVVIDAFLTLPPDVDQPENLPAILRLHGGPVAQFSTRFMFEWQLLAAHGYAVIAPNPRGSSGRGRDFSYAIWADWGNKDFQDVMAAVDHVVGTGVADPERLGVGGWSYGGILTNYVIVQTERFKAAISGSSEVNYTANYGHDHYQRQWEAELGLPWRNLDLWIRLSPFFQVENITTPTLILCGEKDWNVPLQNSEQLYQALRRLGRETQLIIYPGESHGIRVPSYQIDRYQRYLDWYDRFLKNDRVTSETGSE